MTGRGNVVSERVYDLLRAQQQAKIESAQRSSNGKHTGVSNVQQVTTIETMRTKRVDKTNYRLLVGALDLINLSDAYGEVTEFMIKSPSSDFSIIMKVDNEEEYQRTWTEMSALSDDIDSIVASLQNGSYILNMTDIHFSNNIKITVSGRGITFTKLYLGAKYGKLV